MYFKNNYSNLPKKSSSLNPTFLQVNLLSPHIDPKLNESKSENGKCYIAYLPAVCLQTSYSILLANPFFCSSQPDIIHGLPVASDLE